MEEPVALEVGARNFPLVHMLNKDLLPPSGKPRIMFIDRDVGFAKDSDTAPLPITEAPEGSAYAQADVGHLPIADNSLDVIFLKDVFGHDGRLEMSNMKFTGGTVRVGNPEDVLSEFSRILRPGGKVVVVEVATPYDRKSLTDKDMLRKAGLNIKSLLMRDRISEIFKKEENDLESALVGEMIQDNSARDSYAVVFEKQ